MKLHFIHRFINNGDISLLCILNSFCKQLIFMYCIKTEIPQEICDIDDELKAIYHSKDSVCIWVFKTREDRNRFMGETSGMLKNERELHFESFYN